MNNNTVSSSPSVITAPIYNDVSTKHQLFLAGGITNCPDWQAEVIQQLSDMPNLTIFNPRRGTYPSDHKHLDEEQITWEYKHLDKSTIILVWFSAATLNPIVLYELGRWVNSNPDVPAFIGIEPGYKRTNDVIIQTKLARPDIKIVSDLDALVEQVSDYLAELDHKL